MVRHPPRRIRVGPARDALEPRRSSPRETARSRRASAGFEPRESAAIPAASGRGASQPFPARATRGAGGPTRGRREAERRTFRDGRVAGLKTGGYATERPVAREDLHGAGARRNAERFETGEWPV